MRRGRSTQARDQAVSEEALSPFAGVLEAALGRAATAAYRRPWLALGLVVALTAIAGYQTRKLQIDPDLVALLPKSFPSVKGLEEVKRRYGGVGGVAVVARHADFETLRRFAEDVAPTLSELPSVAYVDHRRPVQFFEDRALYFVETDDLEIAKERIQDRLAYEKKKANPLLVELEDSGPPSLDFSDLEEKYRPRGAALGESDEPFYVSEDRTQLLILVKPKGFASDFAEAGRVVRDVESVLARIDPSRYPGLEVELTGRFKKRLDQQQAIQADLRRSTTVALVLVLLYVAFHFRRLRAIPLIAAPLGIGLLWTFGAAATLFGTLNILTAFTGAILLGLGIDHGIHLLERFESERAERAERAEGGEQTEGAEDRDLDAAIRATFGNTGRAVVLAGLTTAVGFAGLAISDFRGFREFGIVASLGVVLVVFAYVLCLPPFLRASAGFTQPRPRHVGEGFASYARVIVRWSGAVFAAVSVAAFFLATQVENLAFDYDFASLEDSGQLRSYALDREVNVILKRQQTPVVLLTDSESDERPLANLVRRNKDAAGDRSAIQLVVSPSDLVPDNQDEKFEILEELDEDLERVDPATLSEEDRTRYARLAKMVKKEPFGREDLPTEVQRRFRVRTGEDGGIVLVYPSVSLSDGKAIIRLAHELRDLPLANGQTVSAAGEAMVLADVLDLIFSESPRVVIATLVLVFFSLWLLLGRIRIALLCFSVALVTVWTMLGAAHLLDLKLNYLNVVLVPVMFGIAVDAGVHLVVRGGASADHLVEAMQDTGRAVWGAALTTSAGFGALLLADHPGLNAFGRLALVGLAANLVATLVWLAALLALRHLRGDRLVAVGLAGSRFTRLSADICTVGGAGYAHRAPGTFGALAGLPAAWLLTYAALPLRLGIIAALVGASIISARVYMSGEREHADPQEIVVDELVGVLIPLAFVPWSLPWVAAGFVLFRFFDIVKPGPVGWVDRGMKNPAGVILDDVVAGVCAAAVLVGVRVFLAG